MGHELGHRWSTYVSFLDEDLEPSYDLLALGSGHWSYFTNSEGSLMHGNAWADNGDGTFSATDGAHTRYSPLDRYLMGLAGPASVPDFFYIANPDSDASPFDLPTFDDTVTGERVDVSLDDIIASEGRRRPAPVASPKSFRTAFLVVGLVGQGVSPEAVAKVENYRRRWMTFFAEATGGRGEVKTALFPR